MEILTFILVILLCIYLVIESVTQLYFTFKLSKKLNKLSDVTNLQKKEIDKINEILDNVTK